MTPGRAVSAGVAPLAAHTAALTAWASWQLVGGALLLPLLIAPRGAAGFLFGADCPLGEYTDKEGNCAKCANCSTGQYRDSCGKMSPGSCAPCSSLPLPNTQYTGETSLTDSCPWACADGYTFEPGTASCRKCEANCKTGEFRKCTNNSDEGCVACEGEPDGAYWVTSGGAGPVGDCVFACGQPGETSGPCAGCKADCKVGEYRQGCNPALTGLGMCAKCTTKPINSSYFASGGLKDACPWACEAGHYNNG